MSRFRFPRVPAIVVLGLMSWTASGADKQVSPPSWGEQLFNQFCSSCHDHPKDRIPAREVIAKHTPDEVLQALTNGLMRAQAAGLNLNDRIAVVTFLTGKAPTGNMAAAPEGNLCGQQSAMAVSSGPQWNGWGRDLNNSRFQPEPGLTAADVPFLKVRWAFGYRGTFVYGQPSIVGGRVYVTSSSGRIYSLDAKTGCTYWTFDAPAAARTAMSVAHVPGTPEAQLSVVFGDDSATVYALNATTGTLIWKTKLDQHPAARISGAPVFYSGRLYVPVSSLEELSALAPNYECCKFRGSVVALDARDGKVLWQTYTIDEKPQPFARPSRKPADGAQLAAGVIASPRYGPAGGAVWSAPTLDPKHNMLYVGTGNSYTDMPAPRTDSIVALDMSTGAIRWVNQLRSADNWVAGCDTSKSGQGNCPQNPGPDVDFGTSPILGALPDGRQVLLTGQKSGQVYGLDPQTGKQLWTTRVGAGSSLGGIEWGSAADAAQLYVAVSDVLASTGKPGGLTALRIDSGEQVWRAAPPPAVCSWGVRSCGPAQSQAVSAMPGVVFSGSQDGHLRAYSTVDGRVVWDFDTAQSFDTVNGVPAAGGSLDHGGVTIAGGMLYVNSGYGRILGQPGNVLLAFAVGGRSP